MATDLFISHLSALQFWRSHDLSPSGGIAISRKTTLRDSCSTLRESLPLIRSAGPTTGRVFGAGERITLESAMNELGIGEPPLHVMVNALSKRRTTTNLATHLYEHPLPEGSFCRVDEHVYVASPELTLAQLTLEMPLVDVLEIALEFCSGYALEPDSESGFIERPAITSSKKLASYAKHLAGRHGAKQLAQILPYLVDDSASPMETISLMLLCLPSKVGGYQLPLPEHNVSIPIPGHAHSHTRRRHLICDLYWESHHLDVECDSTKHHSSKEQLGVDSDRRIILDAMGYPYVGITWWQLEHADEFLNVVQAIRKALHLKPLQQAPAHIEANRDKLREYLVTRQGERRPLMLMTASGRLSQWSRC